MASCVAGNMMQTNTAAIVPATASERDAVSLGGASTLAPAAAAAAAATREMQLMEYGTTIHPPRASSSSVLSPVDAPAAAPADLVTMTTGETQPSPAAAAAVTSPVAPMLAAPRRPSTVARIALRDPIALQLAPSALPLPPLHPRAHPPTAGGRVSSPVSSSLSPAGAGGGVHFTPHTTRLLLAAAATGSSVADVAAEWGARNAHAAAPAAAAAPASRSPSSSSPALPTSRSLLNGPASPIAHQRRLGARSSSSGSSSRSPSPRSSEFDAFQLPPSSLASSSRLQQQPVAAASPEGGVRARGGEEQDATGKMVAQQDGATPSDLPVSASSSSPSFVASSPRRLSRALRGGAALSSQHDHGQHVDHEHEQAQHEQPTGSKPFSPIIPEEILDPSLPPHTHKAAAAAAALAPNNTPRAKDPSEQNHDGSNDMHNGTTEIPASGADAVAHEQNQKQTQTQTQQQEQVPAPAPLLPIADRPAALEGPHGLSMVASAEAEAARTRSQLQTLTRAPAAAAAAATVALQARPRSGSASRSLPSGLPVPHPSSRSQSHSRHKSWAPPPQPPHQQQQVLLLNGHPLSLAPHPRPSPSPSPSPPVGTGADAGAGAVAYGARSPIMHALPQPSVLPSPLHLPCSAIVQADDGSYTLPGVAAGANAGAGTKGAELSFFHPPAAATATATTPSCFSSSTPSSSESSPVTEARRVADQNDLRVLRKQFATYRSGSVSGSGSDSGSAATSPVRSGEDSTRGTAAPSATPLSGAGAGAGGAVPRHRQLSQAKSFSPRHFPPSQTQVHQRHHQHQHQLRRLPLQSRDGICPPGRNANALLMHSSCSTPAGTPSPQLTPYLARWAATEAARTGFPASPAAAKAKMLQMQVQLQQQQQQQQAQGQPQPQPQQAQPQAHHASLGPLVPPPPVSRSVSAPSEQQHAHYRTHRKSQVVQVAASPHRQQGHDSDSASAASSTAAATATPPAWARHYDNSYTLFLGEIERFTRDLKKLLALRESAAAAAAATASTGQAVSESSEIPASSSNPAPSFSLSFLPASETSHLVRTVELALQLLEEHPPLGVRMLQMRRDVLVRAATNDTSPVPSSSSSSSSAAARSTSTRGANATPTAAPSGVALARRFAHPVPRSQLHDWRRLLGLELTIASWTEEQWTAAETTLEGAVALVEEILATIVVAVRQVCSLVTQLIRAEDLAASAARAAARRANANASANAAAAAAGNQNGSNGSGNGSGLDADSGATRPLSLPPSPFTTVSVGRALSVDSHIENGAWAPLGVATTVAAGGGAGATPSSSSSSNDLVRSLSSHLEDEMLFLEAELSGLFHVFPLLILQQQRELAEAEMRWPGLVEWRQRREARSERIEAEWDAMEEKRQMQLQQQQQSQSQSQLQQAEQQQQPQQQQAQQQAERVEEEQPPPSLQEIPPSATEQDDAKPGPTLPASIVLPQEVPPPSSTQKPATTTPTSATTMAAHASPLTVAGAPALLSPVRDPVLEVLGAAAAGAAKEKLAANAATTTATTTTTTSGAVSALPVLFVERSSGSGSSSSGPHLSSSPPDSASLPSFSSASSGLSTLSFTPISQSATSSLSSSASFSASASASATTAPLSSAAPDAGGLVHSASHKELLTAAAPASTSTSDAAAGSNPVAISESELAALSASVPALSVPVSAIPAAEQQPQQRLAPVRLHLPSQAQQTRPHATPSVSQATTSALASAPASASVSSLAIDRDPAASASAAAATAGVQSHPAVLPPPSLIRAATATSINTSTNTAMSDSVALMRRYDSTSASGIVLAREEGLLSPLGAGTTLLPHQPQPQHNVSVDQQLQPLQLKQMQPQDQQDQQSGPSGTLSPLEVRLPIPAPPTPPPRRSWLLRFLCCGSGAAPSASQRNLHMGMRGGGGSGSLNNSVSEWEEQHSMAQSTAFTKSELSGIGSGPAHSPRMGRRGSYLRRYSSGMNPQAQAAAAAAAAGAAPGHGGAGMPKSFDAVGVAASPMQLKRPLSLHPSEAQQRAAQMQMAT